MALLSGVQWNNDPKNPMAGNRLWRHLSDPRKAPMFAKLPDQMDIDLTLDCLDYDVWPYRNGAGRQSFRDLLEGFTDPKPSLTPVTQPPSLASQTTKTVANQTTKLVNTTSLSTTPIVDLTNVPVHMHNLVRGKCISDN